MPEASTPAERAREFDDFFTAHAASRRGGPLMARVLGIPPEVAPTSFVTPEVLATFAADLRLSPGDLLVDLACGRGGPGMWVARETGARLVGVDFSPVAVAHSTGRAALFELADRASFQVGDLAATGLPDGGADGVMCVDAFHFAPDHLAAAREAYRVLRPGGRFALTSWEAREPGDPEVRPTLRDLVVADVLGAAGFRVVRRDERPDLQDLQIQIYREALEAGDPGDDEALRMLQGEAGKVLDPERRLRRLLLVAERPR